MSYEARCILQYMKDKLLFADCPNRADWIELANLIASGELLENRRQDTVMVPVLRLVEAKIDMSGP